MNILFSIFIKFLVFHVGDTANKIGTYQLAIVAKYHGVDFYVAAPLTSIDLKLQTGAEIVVEQRAAEELTSINGIPIAAKGINVWNPAFDITPASLITGIITDKGVIHRKPTDTEFNVAEFVASV